MSSNNLKMNVIIFLFQNLYKVMRNIFINHSDHIKVFYD